MKLKKKPIKKVPKKITQINMSNLQPESQDWDNPMKNKSK
jgi:hypothetical protein